MENHSHESKINKVNLSFLRAIRRIEKRVHPLTALWIKFNNDWSWHNAAGLAYNLLLAVFPLLIALVSLLGLFLRTLAPDVYQNDITTLTTTFSSFAQAKPLLVAASEQVKKDAGVLGLLAIGIAIFNGSRLFLFMEGCLDIIYHVRPRGPIAQNGMAILMLLLFVIVFPIAVVASTGPALVFSLLRKTPLSQIPGSGFLLSLGGILGGLLAGYILFQVIYIIVPNQKISFRGSWLGAVVAAVLLELYLALFPLYVARFLGFFSGALGLLILLIFFYYFALILFLGAEVNAFFAQNVRVTPQDLVTMVHAMTSHLPTSEEGIHEQAAASHKDEPPKEILPKNELAPTESEGRRKRNRARKR